MHMHAFDHPSRSAFVSITFLAERSIQDSLFAVLGVATIPAFHSLRERLECGLQSLLYNGNGHSEPMLNLHFVVSLLVSIRKSVHVLANCAGVLRVLFLTATCIVQDRGDFGLLEIPLADVTGRGSVSVRRAR